MGDIYSWIGSTVNIDALDPENTYDDYERASWNMEFATINRSSPLGMNTTDFRENFFNEEQQTFDIPVYQQPIDNEYIQKKLSSFEEFRNLQEIEGIPEDEKRNTDTKLEELKTFLSIREEFEWSNKKSLTLDPFNILNMDLVYDKRRFLEGIIEYCQELQSRNIILNIEELKRIRDSFPPIDYDELE